MEDLELLDSVCELVAIADAGIADAIGALATDHNSDAIEATLDACLGNIETITTAVEMAQLDDLRPVCAALDAHLRSLNGDAERYLKEYGPRLAHWGGAVLTYLRQPDAPELAESLLGPLPDDQRAELLTCLRLATLESVESHRDGETAVAWKSIPETIPESNPPEWEVSTPVETTPVDQFVDSASVPIADEAVRGSIPDGAEAALADDPEPEWTVEPIAANAEPAIENSVEAAGDDQDGGGERRLTDGLLAGLIATAMEEAAKSPTFADAADKSDPKPAPQPLMIEEGGVNPTEGSREDATAMIEAIAPTPDGPVHWDEADTHAAQVVRQLAEPFAELAAWLAILAAPSDDPIELAHAIVGYTSVVECVRAASEAIGLPGLGAICTRVAWNVQTLAELDINIRLAACVVLEKWPAVVLAYLDDPEDETRCLDVIAHLSQPAWSYPLTEDSAAELVALLAPDADNSLAEVETRPTVAQIEDVALALADDVNPKLMGVFLQESPANAAHLTDCVERIGRGEEVLKNLGVAQRLAHNLKGSANLIGVKGVANLTHHLEDILEYLSERQIAPPPPLASTLQEGADCIEAMLEALQGLTAPPPDARRILQDIYDWANRMDAGRLATTPAAPEAIATPASISAAIEAESVPIVVEAKPVPVAIETASVSAAIEANALVTKAEGVDAVMPAATTAATAAAPAGPAETMLRVPTATFDALFRLVGEFSIAIDQLQERFRAVQRQSNELRNQDDHIQQRRFELENCVDVRHVAAAQQRFHRNGGREQFDPLELDEYDELYGATRGFVETVTDSRKMLLQLRGELASVEHMFVQTQRMKRELQQAVMRTRMEPASVLNARLSRSVRQACRATDKQAELLIEGAEVLLDSEVLNKLVDPLMHMLRNAVDHGIESPEQRIAAGKPAMGVIQLRFCQEGHNVVIDCADDGRGLDYARIRETAAKRGIASLDASDRQALARLVLMPGFTTRAAATQLSGRGVGLDVVHSAIKDLKGVMEIGDNRPGGCRIRLRVPLNLMTHYCLVVEVAGRQYAIPTSAVDRALSPKTGQFSPLGSEIAYELDQHIYPARSLGTCLQVARASDAAFDAQKAVLLVYSDAGLIALAIDRVIDSHHLVVRSLGRHVKTVRGVAGVSSLPDGRLIPVLNLADLLRTSMGETARLAESQSASPEPAALTAPRVLIVDDSLSVRQSLAELMTESGYQPLLARDGVEAVEMLRKQQPDIVLTDIEMPRMNGLELASYIRATHGAALPIITITSRSMQKHRQLAQQAGVNLYLTKPFAEDQLLSGIHSLLH